MRVAFDQQGCFQLPWLQSEAPIVEQNKQEHIDKGHVQATTITYKDNASTDNYKDPIAYLEV